ncbi:hypothetical protein [Ensifer sp. ZNC0028]|uniref:hypothetical protein n=1 Tax=Ensifer sp. ZNC0028 TaxID=1339236 RepID=UPI0012E05CC9|nr:hypothetical protein [Ensifer sp. ZNC0028]
MAQYKDRKGLYHTRAPIFDQEFKAGDAVGMNGGIYRCVACGHEIVVRDEDVLPGFNEHENHSPGDVERWRLLVFAQPIYRDWHQIDDWESEEWEDQTTGITGDQSRHDRCKRAIGPVLSALMENAGHQGWSEVEIAAAILDLTDIRAMADGNFDDVEAMLTRIKRQAPRGDQ